MPSVRSACAQRCYAIGSNSQLVCGRISSKRDRAPPAQSDEDSGDATAHSLRADSRWLGMALAPTGDDADGDVLLGFTAAASLCVVRNAESLLLATSTRDDTDAC